MLAGSQEENWRHLLEALTSEALRPRRDTVVLVDGDRTLSSEDTSRAFLDRAGLPLRPIKDAFERHGYTYPGFLFHAAVYLQVAEPTFARLCQEIAAEVALYPGAADFLRVAAESADVYVVTAGVAPIWSSLLAREGLGEVRVIGGIYPGARYLIGREEKGRVCDHLRAQGRRVIGVGDSDVDSLMLRGAEQAVVVVNHRRNADLLPHLVGHQALSQISHCEHIHPDIPRIDFASAQQIIRGA